MQHLPTDAETVHDPGREILQQNVAALDHPEQQRAAAMADMPSLAFIVISGSFITILGMLIFTVIVYSKV